MTNLSTPQSVENDSRNGRMLSLDAFRGFTIVAMIIVNTPGSWDHVYAPLLHAPWHGVTPTDYIFPFFIFIVGVSITLAYHKLLAQKKPGHTFIPKIVKRSTFIFAIGIFLWLFPDFNFSEIRFPGVLQRIAVVFFCCSILFLFTTWRQQAFIGAAILLLYWAAMAWIPVPEIGAGVLAPGRNLGAWIDNLLIPGTMWQGTWDPEGLLSTLPSIVTGITGLLVGHVFTNQQFSLEQKIILLFVAGFVAFIVGSIWAWCFPLNKNLWTSSYVLFTSGLASMTLALLSYLIDLKGYVRWSTVGLVFGSNAITAYAIGSMLPDLLEPIQTRYAEGVIEASNIPKLMSLLWAVSICILCYIPVYYLYKKRIFIKV